jgi:hypothetical protein
MPAYACVWQSLNRWNRPTVMHKKWIVIILCVIATLIGIRIALPHIVIHYANKALQDIPGYRGSLADVDISLYRGAYSLDEVKIFKLSSNREIPFIDVPILDASVEWKALFDGAIVGEVIVDRPVLNFVNKQQTGEDVNWVDKVKQLLPIRINRLEVLNGTVVFYDFSTDPKVDLRLRELNLVGTNFANAQDQEEALPATLKATAVSIGDGRLTLDMRLDPLKKVPDLDMDLKFEDVNMPALNDFFRAYARVDVEQGNFSLYSEMTVKDGAVQGYIKPVAESVEIIDVESDDRNPISLIWETIVGFAVEIFKNKSEDQLATQVPLSGDLNNVETSVWVAIWNIFRNGFVDAFSKSTNNSIEFGESRESTEEASNKGR